MTEQISTVRTGNQYVLTSATSQYSLHNGSQILSFSYGHCHLLLLISVLVFNYISDDKMGNLTSGHQEFHQRKKSVSEQISTVRTGNQHVFAPATSQYSLHTVSQIP